MRPTPKAPPPVAGNIDLRNRPRVQNADGSISTVRSISINEDGKEILIPTVSPDGRILSDDDAVDLYHRTGQHLGKFSTQTAADSAAGAIHDSEAAKLVPKPATPGNAVYEKNGHRVLDTSRKDSAGHVPTHRVDQETSRRPDQSWEDYEDSVIARRGFSPDTAQRSDLASLQRPVADSARALLNAAKQQGVRLGVSETKRSQERQEMLFQKGRRPGTGGVVTWTLTSDHTPGRAIDFHGTPQAFKWLQQNAPKFGFTVMGAMDPGHVSMR